VNIELDISPRVAEVDVDSPVVDVGTLDPAHPVGLVVARGYPGIQGPPGQGVQVFGEVLTGANGVNLVFQTDHPYLPGSTAVFLNGLREDTGDCYIESPPNMIVFDEAPVNLDSIRIDYIIQ